MPHICPSLVLGGKKIKEQPEKKDVCRQVREASSGRLRRPYWGVFFWSQTI